MSDIRCVGGMLLPLPLPFAAELQLCRNSLTMAKIKNDFKVKDLFDLFGYLLETCTNKSFEHGVVASFIWLVGEENLIDHTQECLTVICGGRSR